VEEPGRRADRAAISSRLETQPTSLTVANSLPRDKGLGAIPEAFLSIIRPQAFCSPSVRMREIRLESSPAVIADAWIGARSADSVNPFSA